MLFLVVLKNETVVNEMLTSGQEKLDAPQTHARLLTGAACASIIASSHV